MMCSTGLRMFGAIKRIFNKTPTPDAAKASPLPTIPQRQAPSRFPATPLPRGAQTPASDGNNVVLTLSRIVELLPKDLQSGVSMQSVQGLTFSIAREKILPQLGHGAVKITYGELCGAFPAGIFANKPAEASRLIDLPLQEILGQVEARTFTRRANQQVVEVPDAVTELFSPKTLANVRVLKKEERKTFATETLRKAAAVPAAPIPAAPSEPASAEEEAIPSIIFQAAPSASPAPAPEPAPKSIAVNPHLAALMKEAGAAPRINAPAYAPPKLENGNLVITLGDMCQSWPEGVTTEIKVQQWTNFQCEIPVTELTASMKTGKMKFPWKQIRGWMKSPPSVPSAHAEALLEMPLKVIANLLLSQPQALSRPAPAVEEKREVIPMPVPAPLPEVPIAPPPKLAASIAQVPVAPSKPSIATAGVSASAKPTGATKFSGSSTQFARRETMAIPLALVSGAWPETLRKEIEALNLAEAVLAVPVDVLEAGLKSGKVAFLWKQVCQWLEACPPDAFASSFADMPLEWPLSVIAPMFLQKRPQKTPKAKALKSDIPDVFSPTNRPNAAPAPAAAPEPEPEPEPEVVQPRPRATPTAAVEQPAPAVAPRSVPKDLAELFGEPEKRNWTPNEIVHKTCTLPGLDGALIALQDGLLVASCMPPAWKSETISAFLPQIFGRMHQYTRELKMGELMSVGFTVEHGTLQIFNAGIIYFAALCKQGDSLPVAELNLIARELSRHTK
jgi:predicted regulator of Ras-like GTPase activity (Roadblock/LC7/MglB family)